MQDLANEQSKYLFYPWSVQSKAQPFEIAKAKGATVKVKNGQELIDLTAFSFHGNIGHGHPAIRQALLRAAENPMVSHPALVHEEKAKLGKTLARITPSAPDQGLVKSFLTLGGAEANEHAIKIARLVTGRHKVVTRYRSYHGATLATIGYAGDYRRIPFDGVVNGVIRIPDPYPRGSGQQIDTVRLLEEILEIEGPETVSCVLLEGITGANGVFVPPADYWPRIREICTRHGILLIADEVMSGFGRTGKWFGIDHFGVTPDIMTLAKGIAGGYAPLGAVVVNEKIARFFDDEMLWSGLTSYAHPLSCTIANAVIDVYEKEGLIENAATRGAELTTYLQALQDSNPMIAETRSIGLLAAIDLQKSGDDSRPYVAYRATGDQAAKASQMAKQFTEAGVLVTVRFGMVIIAPPLCISQQELKKGIKIVSDVLATIK